MLFSSTDRTIGFKPDLNLIKQYDTYRSKYVWMARIALIFTLLSLVAAAKLVISDHGVWAALCGLVALVTAIFSLLLWQTAGESIYATGMLIPGMVTSTNPLKIATIANMSTSDEVSELWGFRHLTIGKLPGYEPEIGQKVACIAGFGGSYGQTAHGMYEPRPLVWATNDLDYLREAIDQIDNHEWQLLDALTGVVEATIPTMTEDSITFFNSDLSFNGLR